MTTEFDQRFNTAQAGGMNAAVVGGVGGEAIMGRRPPSREGLEEEGSLDERVGDHRNRRDL